jgi:hypothetical protein
MGTYSSSTNEKLIEVIRRRVELGAVVRVLSDGKIGLA